MLRKAILLPVYAVLLTSGIVLLGAMSILGFGKRE